MSKQIVWVKKASMVFAIVTTVENSDIQVKIDLAKAPWLSYSAFSLVSVQWDKLS